MFDNVNLLKQNYSKFVQYIIFSVTFPFILYKIFVTEMTPKALVHAIS